MLTGAPLGGQSTISVSRESAQIRGTNCSASLLRREPASKNRCGNQDEKRASTRNTEIQKKDDAVYDLSREFCTRHRKKAH